MGGITLPNMEGTGRKISDAPSAGECERKDVNPVASHLRI